MDHHYFGIRNILALRGDPPRDTQDWQPKANSHHFAHQLISQIKNLNEGNYLDRNSYEVDGRVHTDFCIGAAAYPEEPDRKKRILHFKQKVLAGAQYGITQMVYSAESYAKFLDELASEGVFIPIIPGIRILNSIPQATRLSKRFGFTIPKPLLLQLQDAPLTPESIVQNYTHIVEQFKSSGAVGIHIFILADSEHASLLINHLKQSSVQ